MSGDRRPVGDLAREGWSPKEVATKIGVPYKTVLKLIGDGELWAKKVGRYWIVPATELARYLNAA